MMMELAIGLVLAGALVALLIPLLGMQRDQDGESKDVLAIRQAREALLGQAVVGGGLPAPIQFEEGSIDSISTLASSHLTLNSSLTALPLGWAGALPGQALGVPHVSSLQTAYWYDVQPALRTDASNAFLPKVVEDSPGLWSFLSIIDQFDPDQNANLSTGGHKSQLCRNLNSLQSIEQSIRLESGTNYQRSYLNVTLPRVWGAGFESQFTWDSAQGQASVSLPAGGTTLIDSVFENSAAAAFVVVRRQAPALRRLDRQNAVYWQAGLTGLDKALADRDSAAYPSAANPSVLSGERGFRVYENPSTSTVDNPTADTADYAGLVQSVSLGEFAQSLRNAGLCTTPPTACKANQLFVRLSNSVRSAPPVGAASEGLRMRWSLVNDGGTTTYQTGDVNHGTSTDGVCMDAFGTDDALTAPSRYLRLTFISPAGTVGYTTDEPWYRGGVLVDPNSTQLSDNAGLTRWRPLTALSASEAGKTVTISCQGTHTTTAASPTGELVRGAEVPTCSVTQIP
jgi:type II secretory pathway pseudopilin PulG